MTPREAIAEIRRLIDGTSPGADEWASKKINECCGCLRSHSSKSEQITEIMDWAARYLSARKWQEHGASHIAVSVERACDIVEVSLPAETSKPLKISKDVDEAMRRALRVKPDQKAKKKPAKRSKRS